MPTAVVAVVGGLLTAAGVALLVLPGPGMVLVAVGLAVLASRFAWVKRPLGFARTRAEAGMRQVARRRASALFALGCAVLLLLAAGLPYLGVEVPGLTKLTAILLAGSGVFLVGTVIWARHAGNRAPV
ncbi:PGPGW domain-containing protein [uncultured Pseudokineococcus sp.]|uniref:PGPGW domain-containing protein n=1 Tax=uncultured Pseudokineococcus sp. TaxID=1642928 RepID=UPI0026086E42|nr:PGPGW domain-containing protein [uncultured Pseudokineococcus sp.]